MKTNAEWFNQLPEPYRLKALNNAERIGMLGQQASSLPSALLAFTWDATPEGHAYWKKVFDMVKNNKQNL